MRKRRFASNVVVGAFISVLVAGATTFALTSSNTTPASKAGDGSGAVTGFTVSNIAYSLNATNPGDIDAVNFDLNTTPPSGSTMKAQLASGGAWYTCTNTAAALTCDTTSPQATVSGTTSLRVVVAQ